MKGISIYASLFLFAVAAVGQGALAGPVSEAAEAGDVTALRQVLEAGAEADEKGAATPLYFASRDGKTGIVAVLLEFGADPNAVSPWGAALHAASGKGHGEIVKLLLAAGADADLRAGENNRSPLHDAASNGEMDIAHLLIDAGADVNARATGRNKGPVTHFAAKRGHAEMVTLLRERGAAPEPVASITREELEQADMALGEARGVACTPCHTYNPGDPGERGPTLWNIVGRPVASEPGFLYTDVIEGLGGTWDYEKLNRFLADVQGFAPGTEMYTGSEPDRAIRVALIAYLRTQADSPVPLP